MNLLSLTTGAIQTVNPNIIGTVKVSTGAVMNPDYSDLTTYNTFPNQSFQVQALSGWQIRQAEQLNLQGIVRSVYLNGAIEGLDRPAGKGGDLLVFSGSTWLVTEVAEPWGNDGWTRVVVTLQSTP